MVTAGVFDRFPDLKMVLAHGDAGWAMHYLEFSDINFVRQRHLSPYTLANPDRPLLVLGWNPEWPLHAARWSDARVCIQVDS